MLALQLGIVGVLHIEAVHSGWVGLWLALHVASLGAVVAGLKWEWVTRQCAKRLPFSAAGLPAQNSVHSGR
ncbi:MAG: hypothetical protein HC848_04240 [Limnobacter sp.]|nr:hypothetical protein [Limnobacter sp.]